MKFNQINSTTWESEAQAYTAAMLNSKGEPVGITEARFVIEMGDYKDKTVYRLYERHLNRKQYICRFKTLEAAIKTVESMN